MSKSQTLEKTIEEFKDVIKRAYVDGVTVQEAERYAARSLSVRLELADRIKSVDLDARMKKHGVKAIRGQVYLEEITKHDKKPNEAWLESVVNLSDLVKAEEFQYAEAEVDSDYLNTLLGVLTDAHIYFRAIMRGTYE